MMCCSPGNGLTERIKPFESGALSQLMSHFAGLYDSRVAFWEPTKWVAKTRRLTTGHPVILLYTQMKAGHAGVSGVFSQLRETALEQAFLLRATCVASQPHTVVWRSLMLVLIETHISKFVQTPSRCIPYCTQAMTFGGRSMNPPSKGLRLRYVILESTQSLSHPKAYLDHHKA